MNGLKKRVMAVALTVFTALPVAAQNEVFEVTITNDYNTGSMQWDQSLGDFLLAWDVVFQNGKPMICGAVSNTTSRMKRHNRAILNKGWVKVDGKKTLRNLNYFNALPLKSDFVGEKARCKVLPGTFTPQTDIELGFDAIRVRL